MEKPDVITYRLGQDNYCYVNTPESFEVAYAFASRQ